MECMCDTDQVCFHDVEAVEAERDALRHQVEVLREALGKIATRECVSKKIGTYSGHNGTEWFTADQVARVRPDEIARAALAAGEATTDE